MTERTFLPPKYYKSFRFWLLGHFLRHKWLFISSYIILFLSSLISAVIPLLLQEFFDVGLSIGISKVISISFQFLVLSIIALLISLLSTSINIALSEYIVRDVQTEFFDALHKKNMSFHDSARTGILLSLVTSDSRQLFWMLSSIRNISLSLFTTISILVVMLSLNMVLTGVFLLFLPLILWGAMYYNRHLGPVSLQRQEFFAQWQATLQENLAGVRSLRTLSNREREYKKYISDLESVRDILIRRAIISARYFPQLFVYFIMGILFVIGGYFVVQHDMTVGTLIAFNSLVVLMQRPSDMIRFSLYLGTMGMAGGKRVFSVIREQQEMPDGRWRPEKIIGNVDFRNVGFRYNKRAPFVLKDLNFSIHAGQTVAILGPTGCGKTTLGKLIQRLYDSSEGEILIDGKDIKSYGLDFLRKSVGVIEQDIFLFSASIKENILYGRGNQDTPELIERMIQVARLSQIHDFIMTLPKGYDTLIGERGITLSGGQRQRIAIARAFMVNPSILIMDDSMSSVDALTESQIQTSIANLIKSRTTFIITHRLSTFRNADCVILLKEGKIQDIGTHKELYLRQPDYAAIFKQFEDLTVVPEPVIEVQ